jgi:uncharacterized iron-regulated membrane protein
MPPSHGASQVSIEIFAIDLDRYSGKVLSAIDVTKASLGEKIANGMDIFHFGLFGGMAGRILYCYVGLIPTVLMVTGFVMWQHRRGAKVQVRSSLKKIPSD